MALVISPLVSLMHDQASDAKGEHCRTSVSTLRALMVCQVLSWSANQCPKCQFPSSVSRASEFQTYLKYIEIVFFVLPQIAMAMGFLLQMYNEYNELFA